MLPLVSFETGRKTQTQSYWQPHQLHQQKEGWFYSPLETIADRPTRPGEGRKEFTPALLPKRVRRTFCLLTQTYHGSRQTRSNAPPSVCRHPSVLIWMILKSCASYGHPAPGADAVMVSTCPVRARATSAIFSMPRHSVAPMKSVLLSAPPGMHS